MRIHPGQVKVVCESEAAKKLPANSSDAQFSVHYAVASCLLRGRFTLDQLEDEMIRDPAALAPGARTSCELDPTLDFPRYHGGELVIEMLDGRRLTHREAFNRGLDANPLSSADGERKSMDNARRRISRDRAQRILNPLMGLDTASDVTALTEALNG